MSQTTLIPAGGAAIIEFKVDARRPDKEPGAAIDARKEKCEDSGKGKSNGGEPKRVGASDATAGVLSETTGACHPQRNPYFSSLLRRRLGLQGEKSGAIFIPRLLDTHQETAFFAGGVTSQPALGAVGLYRRHAYLIR